MNRDDRINVGDYVFCLMAETSSVCGEILYAPLNPDEEWIVKERFTGDIYYIKNFIYIKKEVMYDGD